jgi:hypothetical protein
VIALPPAVHPWPIGVGARYHPAPANAKVVRGESFGRFRCRSGRTFDVHVELFAHRRVVIVPPRLGIAAAGCAYALRTYEPTGVVAVSRTANWTLGDLFEIWGRKLTGSRLLSFKGRVSVFVNGRRRVGDPRSVRLRRHDQIVVEIGGYIPPHPSYLFPKAQR